MGAFTIIRGGNQPAPFQQSAPAATCSPRSDIRPLCFTSNKPGNETSRTAQRKQQKLLGFAEHALNDDLQKRKAAGAAADKEKRQRQAAETTVEQERRRCAAAEQAS